MTIQGADLDDGYINLLRVDWINCCHNSDRTIYGTYQF